MSTHTDYPSHSRLTIASNNRRVGDAEPVKNLEWNTFPRAQLTFYDGDRANLAFRRPSPGTLTSRPCRHEVSADGLSNSENDPQARRNKRSAPSQDHDDPCPYFYDANLELKMYRGPGFSQFHPVVGSMLDHKEICDEWDAKQLKRKQSSTQPRIPFRPSASITDGEPTLIDTAFNQPASETFNRGQTSPYLNREAERRCLGQVLTVFPQVQHDFVRKLFRERQAVSPFSMFESQAADAVVSEAIVAEIAELESIPKQKDLKRKHSSPARDNDDVTIRWDKDVLKNETYYKEALKLLADEFKRVPTHFINKTLRERGTLFDTFHFLGECENKYNNEARKPYNRSRFDRVVLEKKYQRTAVERRDERQYISIVNEFQAASQHRHREELRQKRQKADDEAEATNFALHQLQGSLVECQCCFDEAPINRAVNCENDETHFFCNKCIITRAKEQIGLSRHEMRCMDTSGCGAEFSKEALARALPVRISDKLAEIQQQAEIKAADLDGLEQCPFCDYQAVCAPVDVDILFQCLNPSCEKMSCRKCKEESHIPKTCEEAKKDKGLSARHAVEEARTEAMMRSCPKCNISIIKSAGCNKMNCSKCGAVMCYVCKKDITGRNYEHFGSGAGACPIQDRLDVDRHQQEADEAENAAIAAAKARDADLNEDELRIEAHLNQQPGRERKVSHRNTLHRPAAAFQAPDGEVHFPFFQIAQPQILPGGERPGPMIGQNAAQINRLRNLLDEARQQNGRVREMLGEQQLQLHRLHPFIPAPNVHHGPGPLADRHGAIPPVLHGHQNAHHAIARPAINGAPALPMWDPSTIEDVEGIAGRMEDFYPGDMLQLLQRDLGQNDLRHPPQHNRDVFPIQFPPNRFNDGIQYPLRVPHLNNPQIQPPNLFGALPQQQQQVHGTMPNTANRQ